jgi:uncharacterized repeat protein (TIGR01451 family)
MNLSTWIRGLVPRNRSARRNAARGQRSRLSRSFSPRLERLEARITPSLLGTFELDGNATTGVLGASGSTNTSHDWDQVFADAGSPATKGTFSRGATSAAVAGSFLADETTGDAIYTGGSTKDTLPISGWLFKTGSPQDKDEINHAFAAAYTDIGTGHLILYAGLDRFSNSGDSTAGFWFLGNQIAKSTNGTVGGNGAPFTGAHQDGDILLVSDFSVGGSVSTVSVYRWTGNDATGSLVNVTSLGNPNTFAIVNGGPTSVPWSFTDKAGFHQPQAGEFLEEGVDLTALGIQGCFTSFLAESRSSPSPTATLSDFVLGGLPLCNLAATPFNGLSKFDTSTNQGDPVTYDLKVTNTGAMPLYIQSVNDTLLGNIVVNHTLQAPGAPVTAISSTFNFGTPLAAGASLDIFVTRPVQANDPDPTTSTVTYIGTDDLAGLADPITAKAANTVNLFQPSVSMTETTSASAGVVGTPITYTYTVSNTSSTDSPNLVLDTSNPSDSFNSSLFGNIEADVIHALAGNNTATTASLAPGASFSFTETHVLSASDTTPLTDTTNAAFTLASVQVNGQTVTFPNVLHASANTTVRIVNAEISITGSGVNEVNNPHTFTVTVKEDQGDGLGFVAAANVPVTVMLTSPNGVNPIAATPLSGTTDAKGQFQVTFTSAIAGEVIGNANTTLTVQGVTLTRATGDTNAGDSGPATKFFEDAQISIAPNATNGITEPHTFTVTVLANAGDGKGYVPAASVPVMVTLTGPNNVSPITESPLSGPTDPSGHFQVTFTSDSAGQFLGNASTTFTLNGVTLTRATGDGKGETGFVDSGPATKTFVAGSLRWEKVDEAGNLLGGATFQVTATGGTAAGLSPISVSVLDNGPLDADPTPGKILLNSYQAFGGSPLTGLAMGTYTVQEITPPAGYTLDPRVLTANVTLAAPNADLSGTPFVDTLPKLAITKAVTPGFTTVIHPGGTASYTITVTNTGVGTAQNVVVTDNLPDASQLPWTVTSFTGFTSSPSISGGVLTGMDASLAGGASASITVSAAVPLNFFGNVGAANGDAVPANLFELDGNATVDTAGGHDWNQVYADNVAHPRTTTSGALDSSFVTDETTGDDIYTGGSTKDTQGINGWLFKTGKPQDKDEIEHAFAAQYKDPSTNDVILYVGADRFSNSGSSTLGAWFFVNPIAKSTSANVGGSGAPFTGTHATGFFDANHVFHGDILLISNFTQGGSVSTIAVYGWLGSDSNGSLVLLGQTASTVAVVNSGSPGVAWPYTDKAGFSQPQAGEFIEEGVNLSGLGLNPCFSSFLLESRSSPSTTATLSDFILGSFQTCDVMLPNQASVSASNFNNGQPITSNTVTIEINDGMPQEAASVGSGTATASLTQAQLQPVVAQAMAAWRAAGADPSALSNVANYAIHIAHLPNGELGYEVPGQIWIDPTAQGWGWSTGSTPAAGQMDLLTVVTHEVGHVLGLGDHPGGNDIMTTTLDAGMRRLPEAPGNPGSVVSSSSAPGGAGAPALGLSSVAPSSVVPSTPARTGTVEVAVATSVREVVTLPAGGTTQDGVGSQRSLTGVANGLGQQTLPVVSAMPAVPAAVLAGPDRDASSDLVPGLWPRSARVVSGDGALPGGAAADAEPPEGLVPGSDRDDSAFDQDEAGRADVLFQQWASNSCFADGFRRPAPSELETLRPAAEPTGAAPVSGAAAAALALALGGFWGAHESETDPRKRHRFLI